MRKLGLNALWECHLNDEHIAASRCIRTKDRTVIAVYSRRAFQVTTAVSLISRIIRLLFMVPFSVSTVGNCTRLFNAGPRSRSQRCSYDVAPVPCRPQRRWSEQ